MNNSLRTLSTVAAVLFGMLLSLTTTTAQPRWQWVKTAIGPSFDEGRALAMGPDGDLHISGVFYDSISFEGKVLPSLGNYDIFTCRYSSTGALKDWDSYGGLYNDDARSSTVDKNGNVYVSGYFNEAIVVGGQVLDGIGEAITDDIFVSKFDKYGVLLWAKVFGSPEADDDIPFTAVDSLGNVYVAGSFGGRAEFDTKTVTSKGKQDFYLTKLSSTGAVIWVQSYGGSENDLGRAVTVSPNGDRIYVAGTFIGPVYFGIKEIISFDKKADVFVHCFNANGQGQWVDRVGYSGPDEHVAITTDKDGKLIMTGSVHGLTTFFNKQVTANGEFFSDMYLARVSRDGAVEYVKNYGGPYDDAGLAVTVDSRGACYVAGYYDSTSVYGGTIVNSVGGHDIFAARFFPTGDFEWIRTAGGVHDDEARGIVVTKDGIPYVMGTFDTEAWFEGAKVTGELTDMFLAALECGPDTHLEPTLASITICEGQDSIISARFGYPSYDWYVEGQLQQFGNNNRFNLSKLPIGTHTVYVRVTDFYACALNSDSITVNVTEGLPVPTISRLGDDLSCSVPDVMYQWYLEGKPIAGATESFVTISGQGNYRVLIYDERGCSRWSDNFLVGTTGVAGEEVAHAVYPNPFNDGFTVFGWEGATIEVIDVLGNTVARIPFASATQLVNINVAAGSYLLRITNAREQHSMIVTKQ